MLSFRKINNEITNLVSGLSFAIISLTLSKLPKITTEVRLLISLVPLCNVSGKAVFLIWVSDSLASKLENLGTITFT